MIYNLEYTKQKEEINKLNRVYLVDDLPAFVEIVSGTILPRLASRAMQGPYQGLGGVINSNGEFVNESVIYDLKKDEEYKQPLAFGGKYEVKHVRLCNKKVIYLGVAHQHWGHFLIDVVQRCWYPFYNNLNIQEYYYAFSGFGDNKAQFGINYLKFFELLGLDTSRIIIVNEPTEFYTVIVPNVAVYPGEKIHKIFAEMIHEVIKRASQEYPCYESPESIYFSRAHLKDVKETGEFWLERIMVRAGYTVLYPEELSLVQQIFYWQHAKRIACIGGTIPHNCIFCSASSKLYVFNKMKRVVGYQFTLDVVQGVAPIYIDAFKEPFKKFPLDVSRGPFWIYPTDEVKRFFEEKYNLFIKDSTTYKEWIKYLELCVLAEAKYLLRGSGSKLRELKRKISNSKIL